MPASVEELSKLALEHRQAGRMVKAEAAIDEVLALAPERPAALLFKGEVAFHLGRPQEAADLMERALALGSKEPRVAANLCEVYRTLGRYDEALAAGRRGARARPNDPLAHMNLSVLHYARGETAAAIASAERALDLDAALPGAHFGLAEASLARGDWARGWEEYEWRFKVGDAARMLPKLDIPQWDGELLAEGRLMLIADQGYGDCIQFARYIPWAAQRCQDIVIACSRELQPIIAQVAGGARLFGVWKGCPPAQAYAPLSGLPRLAGTRPDTIPGPTPYLAAPPAAAAAWAARLAALSPGRRRRVGVVWAGRPTHRNDANRSIALKTLAPLGAIEGVTLVSLQQGPPAEQIGGYFGRAPLINLRAEVADFTDTMAIIDGLDLVVTVDTAVAHLAGALGKPVWILLPFAADWRWLEKRSDTPWYPSARLFRQPALAAWEPAVSALADAIEADEAWSDP